jgi:hypothetical protein
VESWGGDNTRPNIDIGGDEMSYNWGPNYIIPSTVIESYAGSVSLRENLDEDLLRKELQALGISGPVMRILNPWYFRKKGDTTWIKIGESENKESNFSQRWDTSSLLNGQYEIMGLMHVFTGKEGNETAIARQNVVEVTVKN